MKIVITTGYKFFHVVDSVELKLQITKICKSLGIKGTVIIANEGVNFSLAGFYDSICALKDRFSKFFEVKSNDIDCDSIPFCKLKVKIRPEIVTFKAEGLDMSNTGKYVEVDDWDDFIDSDTVVIDTRNKYEVALGTFASAVNPKTRNFKEFKEWVQANLPLLNSGKRIAMFCTGGVRCEKSTAFLLQNQGFDNVYHLRGGILSYLLNVTERKKWRGSCFVFDKRNVIPPVLDS